MKQRSKISDKAGRTERRKAALKHAIRSKGSRSVGRRKDAEIARLSGELNEALERQTAASDILRIIAGSPDNLEPVFEALLTNAVRLCGAKFGLLLVPEGSKFRLAAEHGIPEQLLEELPKNSLMHFGPETLTIRSLVTRQPVSIEDMRQEPGYLQGHPRYVALTDLGGARSAVFAPMLKGDKPVGVFIIFRQQVGPFTEKQINLVLDFAAQAVIAIENARLLNELRKSLDQQTATAEILRVISSSSTDVQPVFDTIVRRFKSLCGSVFGAIFTFDGKLVHFAGGSGFSPDQLEGMKTKYPVRVDDPSVLSSRTILAKEAVHIDDVLSDPHYDRTHASVGSWRRMLSVPMLRDGEPLGAIVAAWAEPGAIPKTTSIS